MSGEEKDSYLLLQVYTRMVCLQFALLSCWLCVDDFVLLRSGQSITKVYELKPVSKLLSSFSHIATPSVSLGNKRL